MLMGCLVCGRPSRAVLRKQGGGARARYCSTTCKNIAAANRTRDWQKTPRGKFINQRDRAKQRGIEWLFTYEEWLTWWGGDISTRGVTRDDLCMGRFNDAGPYSPANCYKTTMRENHKLRNNLRYAICE